MFVEIHQAAKETVALAEARFLSKQHVWQFDNAWQDMLNHATLKVCKLLITLLLIWLCMCVIKGTVCVLEFDAD